MATGRVLSPAILVENERSSVEGSSLDATVALLGIQLVTINCT
jgi:hypothetical protein